MDYPASIVWMIECRYWPDEADMRTDTAIGDHGNWTRYAPVAPSGLGSGVVVRLERLDENHKPLKPPSIKNYVLTCAHVLNSGRMMDGPIAKEIICWQPGYGYGRTLDFNALNHEGRLKKQMNGGFLASISELSPREDPNKDWALLEITDIPGRTPFNDERSLKSAGDGKAGTEVILTGYPYGAGWENDREGWKSGTHYWATGKLVEPFSSELEKITSKEGDILQLRGDVEVRPGMSGGGVFHSSDNALEGLHRSRHDAALSAKAICYAEIVEWLWNHRHVKPVYPMLDQGLPPRHRFVAVGVAVLAIFFVLAALKWFTPSPPSYVWRGKVEEIVTEGGVQTRKPVNGATVMPHLNNADITDLQITTPFPTNLGPGEFEISTTNPQHYSDDVMIKIAKDEYKTLLEDAQAVVPRADGKHHVIYTIRKPSNP